MMRCIEGERKKDRIMVKASSWKIFSRSFDSFTNDILFGINSLIADHEDHAKGTPQTDRFPKHAAID